LKVLGFDFSLEEVGAEITGIGVFLSVIMKLSSVIVEDLRLRLGFSWPSASSLNKKYSTFYHWWVFLTYSLGT